VHIPGIIDNAYFGEMVRGRENLSLVLDSALQKPINLGKIFHKVSTN
jgi:hypothetical protein